MGKITLSSSLEIAPDGEGLIKISVADTGVGISKDQQESLFSNFTQANPSIAAKFGGTGLGLSLSQNLCRLMDGQISVESELGKGSCFTISLPAKAKSVDVAESASRDSGDEDEPMVVEAEAANAERRSGYAGLSEPVQEGEKRERVLIVVPRTGRAPADQGRLQPDCYR